MRLTSVTVQNYRSITRQTRFSVDSLTTLVGPNNEGKSNLLKALVVAMQIIENWSTLPNKGGKIEGPMARFVLRGSGFRKDDSPFVPYSWSEDYPLNKQGSSSPKPTAIRLDFKLSDVETHSYRERTGLSTNGDLPILISIDRRSVSLGIVKPGKGAATHLAKSKDIARFITDRISIVSVPAIRTGEQAVSLASDLVRIRMQSTLRSDEYRELSNKLEDLRREAVDEVAADVSSSVAKYVPSVSKINFQSAPIKDSFSVSNLTVQDEVETPIENKGDGIKSLITMALIQELAKRRSDAHGVVLAVDEPEAHLHSGSVHELQTLFESLAEEQQVILATHNPIFVNRDNVKANILVQGNSASPAKKVEDVRRILGVHMSDNLASAETVVLVEGVTDEKVLPRLIAEVDPEITSEVKSGRIVFKATRGAGKMRFAIQREKSTACKIRVILDNDQAGRQEASNIDSTSTLSSRDVFLLGPGPKMAELEDLIEEDAYLNALSDEFGREFTEELFKDRSKKWSDKLVTAMRTLGVPGESETLIDAAKLVVSNSVEMTNSPILKERFRAHAEALAKFVRN